MTGSPAVTRNARHQLPEWNDASPASRPRSRSTSSARWTRTLPFDDGVYQFTTTSDDGARVYVDGVLVLNFWIDQGPTAHSVNKQMSAGNHTVVVEYYENSGGASMVFDLQYRPDFGFATDNIVSGLTLPTVFAFLPDGRILLGQKDGTIKVFKTSTSTLLPTPYYTVPNVNDNNDRGLLGMTVAPDFAGGWVYISYSWDSDPSNPAGPKTAQVIGSRRIRLPAMPPILRRSWCCLELRPDRPRKPSCDVRVTGVSTSGVWTTGAWTTPATANAHQLLVGDTLTLASAIGGAVPRSRPAITS